jgi:hypothetical protein
MVAPINSADDLAAQTEIVNLIARHGLPSKDIPRGGAHQRR